MIYQLKITLLDHEPKIWRIVEVKSSIGLLELHAVIQTAMGWTNSHLHHFIKNNVFYALPVEGSEDFEPEPIDESNVQAFDILTKPDEKVIYEYDFGDGWEHEIELLKISDGKLKSPVCLQGENACPPEDCGGVGGYEKLLEIITDPEHEEYEKTIEWLNDDFDPSYFNLDETNDEMKNYMDYCDW